MKDNNHYPRNARYILAYSIPFYKDGQLIGYKDEYYFDSINKKELIAKLNSVPQGTQCTVLTNDVILLQDNNLICSKIDNFNYNIVEKYSMYKVQFTK